MILALKRADCCVLVLCLVLGDAASLLNDHLQPPGHGLDQAPHVVTVRHPQDPEPGDGGLQLCHGVDLCVLKLSLHPCPAVLDGVEVWAVAWPVDQGDGRTLTLLYFYRQGRGESCRRPGPGDQLLTGY